MKKIIAITMAVIMAAISLTGCNQTKGFLGGTKKSIEIVESSDVYIPIEKMRTLNPVVSKDEDAYYINKLIYEGLFQFDENLNVIPDLAESYEYTDQGSSLTIYLKDGIKWQDGSSFTAEDVKFTIQAYLSAAGASIYSSYVNNIKSVTAKDSRTVVVSFKDTKNVDIDNFVFPIISKRQYKNSSVNQVYEKFIPVGTGAYKVESYDSYSKLVLVPNEAYGNGTAANNKLIFQVMEKKQDAINLVDMNAVSVMFSKQIDRDTIYSNKEVNVKSFPSNEVEFIGFNFKKKPFDDRRIRQAIASVTDVQNIIETGYYNSGKKNDNIYYPNYLGIESKKNLYKVDPDKAIKLLAQAGYIDRDNDGKVENVDNEKLNVNILVNENNPSRVVAAQTIKNGLDKLPIDSNVVIQDWDSYNSSLSRGDFDIYIGGFQIKDTYDLRFMLHTNYSNIIGYSNPELDTLLDKMESGISQEEKKVTFQKVKAILNKEIPYYCLLYKTYGAVSPKSFKGKPDPMFNNFYRSCQDWKSVYEKQQSKEEQ